MSDSHPGAYLEVPAVWMRGGTSKCWLLDADIADAQPIGIEPLLESAFGAGDARQIDGVGGATSTTSKAMLVRRSDRTGLDVDYTFAQIGIGDRLVEWGSNCGNCATAVGLYSVQEGLVDVTDDVTTVRMYNTNTATRIDAVVDTRGGKVPRTGAVRVPGVRSGGVGVDLRFNAPFPHDAGSLFPTGSPIDSLSTDRHSAAATIVDAGAMTVLLDAAALTLTGSETRADFAAHVPALIDFRREAAIRSGLIEPWMPAPDAVPKVGIVGPPADYICSSGEPVRGRDYDIAARMVSMHAPHPAIGLTSAVAVAVAAATPGTTAHAAAAEMSRGSLRIGTPAGIVSVALGRDDCGELRTVTLPRAARRLSTAVLEVPIPPTSAARGDRDGNERPATTTGKAAV